MADETRTVEFKIKTTADKAGGEAVSKQALDLQKRFAELAVELDKVSKDGATVKTKALLPMSMALEQLKAEAKEAGIAVEGLDKAAVALEKAGVNAAKTAEALEDLKKKTGDAQAKVGGMGDLFDKGGTKMERFRNGVGMVGGALATGFAIGTAIAKKAGVDFTETLATMSEWATKAAVAINEGITKAMGWLAGVAEKAARALGFDGLARDLEDVKNGLDGISAADAGRAKSMEETAKQQAAAILLTQKTIAQMENQQIITGETEKNIRALAAEKAKLAKLEGKTLEEQKKEGLEADAKIRERRLAEKEAAITVFELEVELRKKTTADIIKLNKLRLDLAKAQRKGPADLRAVELQGEQELAAFNVETWTKEQAEWEAIQAKRLAATAAMEAKAKSIGGKFFAAQSSAVDSELAHLQATHKLTIAEFERLTKKKIELAWLASDKGIEAAQAKASAEIALEDSTVQMKQEAQHATVENTVGGINAGLSAAAAAFPENKEIQIAQAVMTTYQSATSAFSAMAGIPIVGPALGAVAAALAIVAGLKNVENIQAQQPPDAKVASPSFDDPVNDAMARRAGRQSAIDLVNHTSSGFQQQLASGQSQRMDGNTTTASVGGSGGGRGNTTINVMGSGPTQEVTRGLRRALLKYDQKVEVNVRGNRSKRVF